MEIEIQVLRQSTTYTFPAGCDGVLNILFFENQGANRKISLLERP
jgi:hypothetical protein